MWRLCAYYQSNIDFILLIEYPVGKKKTQGEESNGTVYFLRSHHHRMGNIYLRISTGQEPLSQLSDFVCRLDDVCGGTAPSCRRPDIHDGITYCVFWASAGAGLSKGEKLTKLLAERVDKAMLVYQKAPTPPYLIPSGGRGDDEKISEAEAMKKYLIENGIPEDHILAEDQSTTTFENLVNSKKIIDARGGRCYTALVTSNYHVYRALRYCRKVGLQCTGIGSHVAFYYWPSALIREYVKEIKNKNNHYRKLGNNLA